MFSTRPRFSHQTPCFKRPVFSTARVFYTHVFHTPGPCNTGRRPRIFHLAKQNIEGQTSCRPRITIRRATNFLHNPPLTPTMHFDWTCSSHHCSSAAQIFHFRLIRIHSNGRNSIFRLYHVVHNMSKKPLGLLLRFRRKSLRLD